MCWENNMRRHLDLNARVWGHSERVHVDLARVMVTMAQGRDDNTAAAGHQIEVEMTMLKSKKSAIATIAVLAGTMTAMPLASASANCSSYAKLSLQQQQENVRKNCGFAGPEWTSDMKALVTWCSKSPPQAAQAMLKKRSAALAGCKG
jgi:hypothetical protein